MFATFAALIFAAAGCAGLAALAVRDHRAALALRRGLLDPLAPNLRDSRIEIGPDGFPKLTGRLPDRRHVTVELLADTLVTRRLPQLWLIATVREQVERPRPSLGALARPTGAEFYSAVYDLPERIEAPAAPESSPEELGLLIRGDGRLAPRDLGRSCETLRRILADRHFKEVVATARGVRVVRQAAQGDRGAHLVLRQVIFAPEAVSPALLDKCLEAADLLRETLDSAGAQRRLSA